MSKFCISNMLDKLWNDPLADAADDAILIPYSHSHPRTHQLIWHDDNGAICIAACDLSAKGNLISPMEKG